MKTKDGRSAYGTGRKCDCGQPATVKYTGCFICERCCRIQKKMFSDNNYCGVHVTENSVTDKDGDLEQVHEWRSKKVAVINYE